MALSITVIGSTGLIGKQFLESIQPDDYAEVIAITRRSIPSLDEKPFIRQAIHDFTDIEQMRLDLKTDVLVCALGTTIKTAGSQDAFMRVDHDLPLAIARMALEEGCKRMVVISSVGGRVDSSNFYLRVKGLLEDELSALGFEQLHILKPSMLLGDREETRAGESVGKLIIKPLSFIIPWKFKPIHATTVAATIHRSIQSVQAGKHIWEGKPLFTGN
ncbi:MAG: NAD-dependent epimerase/dehydratase family protein [Candidatus Marinimicrobia bacterium]|nr:NAD-dependent epimerase/dehydratase family protein [Candidatus Neomarinimicrobiota bacterium]